MKFELSLERKICLILPENLWGIIEDYNEYSIEKTLKGHNKSILDVCFYPNKRSDFNRERNGEQIISGSMDKTIKIWDFETGKCEQTLRGHTDYITTICVTPNGKQSYNALPGSADETIKIWDLETGKFNLPVKTLRGHTNWVNSVYVTPNKRSDFDREGNSKKIISGGRDGTIKIWDFKTGDCEKTLKGHGGWIRSVCLHPNGKQIISGNYIGTIKIWDLETGNCEKILEEHTKMINFVCITPNKRSDFDREGNGKQIISGSFDKTIKIWDFKIRAKRIIRDNSTVKTLKKHAYWVNCVCVTPDGKRIISGGEDRTIKIRYLKTNELIQILRGHTSRVNCVRIHPNKKQIISGSCDNTIKIWTKKIFNNQKK